MTAAVGLLVILAALTAQPAMAMAICVLFGLVRGSWVLLTARVRTPDALRRLLRRIDQLEDPIKRVVMTLEVAAGSLLAADLAGWLGVILFVVGSVPLVLQVKSSRRMSRSVS